MVLGGQFVSRINLKLREEKGYTYGARTAFDFRRGRGPFLLQTSVQTAVTAAALVDVFAELEQIRGERPVTEAEMELAKAALTRGYARNFETADQLARALAQLVVYGLPDDYYDRLPDRVREVDAATLARAAATHLHPERMFALLVGDRNALEPSLGPPDSASRPCWRRPDPPGYPDVSGRTVPAIRDRPAPHHRCVWSASVSASSAQSASWWPCSPPPRSGCC